MEYVFTCEHCKKKYTIEIPIEKYDDEKYVQHCPKCGALLKRKIEWNGSATINGGYESVAGRANWQ